MQTKIQIYNTLTRKLEEFSPLNPPKVSLYTCGVTVYDYTHIGHLRKYTNDDVLKRALTFLGYEVDHIQNITDVGHLVSDGDSGEDKFEKGAKREGVSVWDVAKRYEDHMWKSFSAVNLLPPRVMSRATEHIKEQIALIEDLFEKGFAYDTASAVYFDISKFNTYGKLSGQNLADKLAGARDEVVEDANKKHPLDFVLWFKRVGDHANHTMHWNSPWGDGFPGWHIECSAMAMHYLGDTLDIHTGGVDHIPVHHENEIAQSEGATGKTFVKYWVHNDFLVVDGVKMSKSLNNFYKVEDIIEKGFDPLALRLLFFTTHYRQKLNFTWEALTGAQNALANLRIKALELKKQPAGDLSETWKAKFAAALADDFNMPKALAVLWDYVKSSDITYGGLLELDTVLGLNLSALESKNITKEASELADKRFQLRKLKDFESADKARDLLVSMGYIVKDTDTGTELS